MLRPYQLTYVEDVQNVWATASAVARPFLGKAFLELERFNIPNVYLPQAQTWGWVVF